MKAQTIEIQESAGRILSSAIFRPGGKKLMAKGHILREEDVRVLQSEGMEHIWVTELEEGEISEDEAVCAVAGEMACGSYEIQLAPGGRANLIATENCCVLVDDELLRQVNCTSGVVIATTLNFSFAMAGQRIATVKSAPFAVSKSDFDGLIGMLRERGPIMQARPMQARRSAVLYCDPVNGDRARTLFESVAIRFFFFWGENSSKKKIFLLLGADYVLLPKAPRRCDRDATPPSVTSCGPAMAWPTSRT